MNKWAICNKTGDFEGISKQFGLSAVSARLLVNRDIVEAEKIREFFEPDISRLQSPNSLISAFNIFCPSILFVS